MRCPGCRKAISVEATTHPDCGWGVPGAKPTTPALVSLPEQDVPPAERARIKALISVRAAELAKRPPKDMLAHWQAILARPGISVAQRTFAEEAIATLQGKRMSYLLNRGKHREPGQDDEEIAA